jgi:hypothetical protein
VNLNRSKRVARIVWSRAVALAGIVTLASLVSVVAPAGAVATPMPDWAKAPGVPTVQFTKSTGFGTMTTITCYGQSDYPHASSQQPGTVHGKSRSWCSAPIPQVRVQAELWRYLDGYGYSQVGTGSLDYCLNCTGAATPKLQSIAIDICQSSTKYYITVGRHTFFAPPGYSPPDVKFDTWTAGTPVTCSPY